MEEATTNDETITVTDTVEDNINAEKKSEEEEAKSNDIGYTEEPMETDPALPKEEENVCDIQDESHSKTDLEEPKDSDNVAPLEDTPPVDVAPLEDTLPDNVASEENPSNNVAPIEEAPQPSIEKVLSVKQIDEMFGMNDNNAAPVSQNDERQEEEPVDLNPQVNIEDMKVVQDELREVDVLVCGSCHLVFHFVEEFKMHKPLCRKKSEFHGNNLETKPQVWAFLLWKNAQSKSDKMRGLPVEESSWKLYQKWCKMPENIRNTWVAAGETVMNFSNFGHAKPTEPMIKALQPRRIDGKEDGDDGDHKPVIMKKLVQRDSAGEIREIKASSGIKRKFNEDAENIRSQLEDSDGGFQERETSQPTTMAGQDGQEDTLQEEEFVVEKIVSRRFNPRKKQYEYLLKWEGYPSEQNTWEPAENLEACQHLLKAFEESLAKQSLNKQKASFKQKVVEHSTSSSATPSFSNYGGRPIRYSKQKALSQVKQWCGSIKPDDAEIEMLKHKMPVTDSDEEEDPYSKRMRLDRGSDSEDSVGASKVLYTKASGKSGIIRRPGRPPLKPKITNGTTESLAAVLGLDTGDDAKASAIEAINRGIVKKSTGMSLHNQQVLVANAKGVVKVDPSQVPNLASGVYIMSNKSGIIKLDSVSPSKALSLKGVSPSSGGTTVKQLGPSGNVTSTSSQSGVIVVNRENTPRSSGVMRRPGGRGRGVGRPPLRGNPSYRGSPNPNTRLIHSGTRPNFTISPAVRPGSTTVKSSVNEKRDGERKILGPKPSVGRGGISRGAMRGGRGGTVTTSSNNTATITTVATIEHRPKELEPDNVFLDLPQENSSDSEPGLPDLFPSDLPPMEPESPPRPLTLCPETGKVLLKAEGEKTPEPTPPQSPKTNSLEAAVSEMIRIKEEPGNRQSPDSSFLKLSGKDPLVKKTLKPGSIGSMSVSPKKSFSDADDDNDIVTISSEDGTVYKVRKSELTNSLLVGEDGQQCLYVTTGEDGEEGTVLTLDPSYGDSVTQLGQVNILGGEGESEATTQFFVKEGEEGELVSLEVDGAGGEGVSEDGGSQVVAQLVEASEPEPGGGPRRVVLLLPDGNLMMTEVDEEQYAALELDKYQATSGDME